MYTPTPQLSEQIRKAFQYHAPLGDQPQRYVTIRDAGRTLASTLAVCCPPSRELSLALTSLEQTAMWANAAIARNESPLDESPTPVPGPPNPPRPERRTEVG